MWKLKNSLNNKFLKYFLLFAFLILGILWLFQILFFDSFYRRQKFNDIISVSQKIEKKQFNNNFYDIVNNLAFDKSVCIEIIDSNYDSLYRSSFFGKGCFTDDRNTRNYKFDFINSSYDKKAYELINDNFNTKTLVYAVRLESGRYTFINTSLEPTDGTVNLIRNELILISLIIIILSFILAYFMSNHISQPINKISLKAREFAKGNFAVNFDSSKILEVNELASTLNYARDELSKTEEYRRDLMANVSHDLKTPLTMIKAYAEMAKDLHSDDCLKRQEDMDIIVSEVDRLTILVNDILDLSKMESLEVELNFEEFDLILLIKDIIKKYKVLMEQENYKFKFIHKNKKVIVTADKKKIAQVIYNLINNAINYTGEDNTVTIRVSVDDKILVEIIDTGCGIKEQDIPYIWDKYYKNKKKHKRNLIGTGLGLSIVKNILETHGFKYGVISNSSGSNFYFEINSIDKEKC